MTSVLIGKEDNGKYPLINNPFVKLNSFVKPRLTLNPDPIIKKGNTHYSQFLKNAEGDIFIENELDPKLNYFISPNLNVNEKEDEMVLPLDEGMLDYCVSAETLNKHSTNGVIHKDPLPLSYINIKTEEEGLLWYRRNYPKIPDDLLPIIARYHWGDAINKSTIKKEKKKNKKKLAPLGLVKNYPSNKEYILKFE